METSVMDQVLDKVNELIEIAPESNVSIMESSENVSEEENLFTESIDDFSTAPIVFEEAAARLLNKVEELFDLSSQYDRNVPQYLECCGWLEKGIKAMASAALTKICLEKRDYEFPLLGQLSTQKLYEMASFNFRKIDDTLSAAIAEKKNSVYRLLNMEYRYYHLLDRLKVTEDKIYNINLGLVSEEPIVQRALQLSKESWNGHYAKKQVKKSDFRKTTAFPVIGSAIREAEWDFHQKEKQPVKWHDPQAELLEELHEYQRQWRAKQNCASSETVPEDSTQNRASNPYDPELVRKMEAESMAKQEQENLISETCQKIRTAAGINGNSAPASAQALNPGMFGKTSAVDIWNTIFAMQSGEKRKSPPGRA